MVAITDRLAESSYSYIGFAFLLQSTGFHQGQMLHVIRKTKLKWNHFWIFPKFWDLFFGSCCHDLWFFLPSVIFFSKSFLPFLHVKQQLRSKVVYIRAHVQQDRFEESFNPVAWICRCIISFPICIYCLQQIAVEWRSTASQIPAWIWRNSCTVRIVVIKYYYWDLRQNNNAAIASRGQSSNPNDATTDRGAEGAKSVSSGVLQTLSLMSM